MTVGVARSTIASRNDVGGLHESSTAMSRTGVSVMHAVLTVKIIGV